MQKLISTGIALSLLLIAAGCSSNNQTVQQKQACTVGDPHPWCMQMAQTQPLGDGSTHRALLIVGASGEQEVQPALRPEPVHLGAQLSFECGLTSEFATRCLGPHGVEEPRYAL